MADSVGDRNIDEVAKVLTKELLETAIKLTDEIDDVCVSNFGVTWAGKLGDNMATFVLRVKVDAVCSGTPKEYNLILKTSQDNPGLNEMMVHAGMFKKEIGTYVDIVPAFIKMQSNLGVEPILPSVPKFFYGSEDDLTTPGVVLVEDLSPFGFKMIDKSTGADLSHCKLVMKSLATWHALSMVLKRRDPDSLKTRFPFVFKEAQFGSAFESFYDGLDNSLKAMVDSVQESSCTGEIKARAMNFLDIKSVVEKIREVLQPEEPYAVICHGDSWCNNMMFRYENIDGVETPVEIKLLDLQIVRYALPTTDLSYFIFLNTSRSLRKAHLGELLELYHETFTNVLQHCKYEFPEFTLDVLKGLFRKTAIFGMLFGAMALEFFYADQEAFEDIEKMRREAASLEEYAAKLEESKRRDRKKVEGLSKNNKKLVQAYVGLVEDAMELNVI